MKHDYLLAAFLILLSGACFAAPWILMTILSSVALVICTVCAVMTSIKERKVKNAHRNYRTDGRHGLRGPR